MATNQLSPKPTSIGCFVAGSSYWVQPQQHGSFEIPSSWFSSTYDMVWHGSCIAYCNSKIDAQTSYNGHEWANLQEKSRAAWVQ